MHFSVWDVNRLIIWLEFQPVPASALKAIFKHNCNYPFSLKAVITVDFMIKQITKFGKDIASPLACIECLLRTLPKYDVETSESTDALHPVTKGRETGLG